ARARRGRAAPSAGEARPRPLIPGQLEHETRREIAELRLEAALRARPLLVEPAEPGAMRQQELRSSPLPAMPGDDHRPPNIGPAPGDGIPEARGGCAYVRR